MRAVGNTHNALGRLAIDEMVELYVSWREECDTVQRCYEGWVTADRGEAALAYAAYHAALDREEHAARIYADHVDRVGDVTRVPAIFKS